MDALVRLHPAWTAVDRLTALTLPAPTHRLPAPTPLGPPPAVPSLPLLPVPSERAARPAPSSHDIVDPTMKRVKGLRERLPERVARILAREHAALNKAVDAEIAARREALLEQRREEESRTQRSLDVARRDLQIRELVLENRIAHYTDPTASLSRAELQDVRTQLAAIDRQIKTVQAETRSRYAQLIQDLEEEPEPYVVRRQALREQDLLREARTTLASYEARVRQGLLSLAPLDLPTIPPTASLLPARMPAPAALDMFVRADQNLTVPSDTRRQTAAQREALLASIQSDTRRAIARAADRNGWRILYSPAPGVPDMTTAVADAIGAEWRP